MSSYRVHTHGRVTKSLRNHIALSPPKGQIGPTCPVDRCAALCDTFWKDGNDLDFSLEVSSPFDSFVRNAVQYVLYLGRPERRSTSARLLYFLTHEPSFLAIVQHLTYLSLARARQSDKFVFVGTWSRIEDGTKLRPKLQRVATVFPELFNALVDLLGWVMKYPGKAQVELEARLSAAKVA